MNNTFWIRILSFLFETVQLAIIILVVIVFILVLKKLIKK